MATITPDPLKRYLRPGYPKVGVSGGSYKTELRYIGDHNSLFHGGPRLGAPWGSYNGTVEDVQLDPLEGTDPLMGELSVNLTRDYGAAESGGGAGNAAEVIHEVDWTTVNRPLIEHPKFGEGEFYELFPDDYQAITVWEDDKSQSNYDALSSNAKKYADGINRGITTFDDYAPVASISTGYTNGPPNSSSAGAKGNPPSGFPCLPTGYEWVKSADRSLRTGRRNKWERSEQWIGAKKILVDKNNLYY